MENITNNVSDKAIQILRKYGCAVVMMTKMPKRNMINIECPTADMMYQAIEIRQRFFGVHSTIYALNIEGTLVRWSGNDHFAR